MQAQRISRRLLKPPYPHRCCSSQRWAAYPFPRYAENAAPPQKPPFGIAPHQQPLNVPQSPFGMPHLWPPPPPGAPPPPPPPPSPQRFMEVKPPVQVNEASEAFAGLIESLQKRGMVQEVDRVIQAMNSAQIMLSLPSYRTLIDMYAEQGDLERMDTVYFEMRKATMRMSRQEQAVPLPPPSPMQRQQASELLAGLMDQCHKRGMHAQVQLVHKAMKAAQVAIPIPMYNILMDTYSQLGDCDKMDAAYMEMRQSLAHKRGSLPFAPPPPPPPPPPPFQAYDPHKFPPPPPPPPAPSPPPPSAHPFHSPRPPPGFGAGHFHPNAAFQPQMNVSPAHHFQPPPPPPPPGFHYPPVPAAPALPVHGLPPAPAPEPEREDESEAESVAQDDNDESVVEAEVGNEIVEVEAQEESLERDDQQVENEENEGSEEAANAEAKQPLMESTG